MAISQSLYNCLRTKTADLVGGFLGNRLRTNVEGQGRGEGHTFGFEEKKSVVDMSVRMARSPAKRTV